MCSAIEVIQSHNDDDDDLRSHLMDSHPGPTCNDAIWNMPSVVVRNDHTQLTLYDGGWPKAGDHDATEGSSLSHNR